MKVSITKGLEADHAKELTLAFKSSAILRKRLVELLEDKIGKSNRGTRSESGYDCPNWAYKQADARGYERALQEVISNLED